MRVVLEHDDVEMARLLIDAGSDVNAKDPLGNTPLSYAWMRGHERVARYLESRGAK